MRRILLILLACSLACTPEEPYEPSIILLMADDLGWGDTGYNGNPVIRTPNLDQMAKDGITFNRFYASAPVCSPTRASCLTGRHPYRTGVFYANTGILRPEEITLAEVLRKGGYATGLFGKWHLGTLSKTEKDANLGGAEHPELYNPPSEHGFDTYFCTESKVPTWDPMHRPTTFTEPESKIRGWAYLKDGEETEPYGTAYWTEKGTVTGNLHGDDSRVIMDRAIPFIEDAARLKKPFFAVIWFHAPHLPCVAGPEYAEMYEGQEFGFRQFAGCITAMDEQIGRLRKKLQELRIDENTMVWFCSDNGPEGNEDAPGSTGGFRGRKRSLYEGGIRVPGLLVWPEGAKPQIVEAPVVTSDYMPTILEAVGLELPRDAYRLDGVSIVPLLKGEDWERPAPIAFASMGQFSYSRADYKLVGRDQLFHISEDPYELNNIADLNTELVKEYLEAFTAWNESCKQSFEGREYGTESLKRVAQEFPEPDN